MCMHRVWGLSPPLSDRMWGVCEFCYDIGNFHVYLRGTTLGVHRFSEYAAGHFVGFAGSGCAGSGTAFFDMLNVDP